MKIESVIEYCEYCRTIIKDNNTGCPMKCAEQMKLLVNECSYIKMLEEELEHDSKSLSIFKTLKDSSDFEKRFLTIIWKLAPTYRYPILAFQVAVENSSLKTFRYNYIMGNFYDRYPRIDDVYNLMIYFAFKILKLIHLYPHVKRVDKHLATHHTNLLIYLRNKYNSTLVKREVPRYMNGLSVEFCPTCDSLAIINYNNRKSYEKLWKSAQNKPCKHIFTENPREFITIYLPKKVHNNELFLLLKDRVISNLSFRMLVVKDFKVYWYNKDNVFKAYYKAYKELIANKLEFSNYESIERNYQRIKKLVKKDNMLGY